MKVLSPQYRSQLKTKSTTANGRVTFSLGYALLCHWLGLGVVLLLLLLAAIYQFLPLLVLTVFLFVLTAVSWVWSRWSLEAVSSQLSVKPSCAFPGEAIDVALAVINRKWLPLPWLKIEVDLPYKLAKGRLKLPSPYARERLRWTTAISGQQRVDWRYHLECQARGDYRLGPLRLSSGDIFGLFPRETIQPHFAPLLVYPRIVPVDKLSLPLRELAGERSAPRHIYEDVSRTMGTRDYRHDDPFKRIHWKASARGRQLQVKQYESTTSLSLLLILDVGSFCQPEGEDEEAFELAITTVASLAYQAHRERSAMGLMANSVPEIEIPTSSAHPQLIRLLEALARIQPKSRLPLALLLRQDEASLPLGTVLVVVTHQVSPPVAGLVQRLHQEGHCLLLLNVGQSAPAPGLGGVPAISILSLGDLSRSYQGAKP